VIPVSSATAAERAQRILKVRKYPLAAYGLALLMVALAVLVRGLIGYIGVQVFTTF
jgi:ABC-type Fe3+-siderophore transport system permease subunit